MNSLKLWLIETLRRTQLHGSPYFKYWGKINIVLMIVAGLPNILIWIDSFFEIDTFNNAVPHPYWIRIMLKVILGASVWGKLISSLSVKNNHEIVQEGDVLMQKTCEDLPFTEKKTGVTLVEPVIK